MTIERIQSANLSRNPGAIGRYAAPLRSEGAQGMDSALQDRVVVSDQAQQLSAAAKGEQGSGLQLDFKKLRELAFPTTSPSAAPADQAE